MSKKVDYTSRDFNALKLQLEKFGEQYFPNVFNNFNDFSPETMFIEMMAFVGDNLNFNIDENYRTNFLRYLGDNEIESAFRLAKEKGYKPQIVSVAIGSVEISQIVPSKLVGSEYEPDLSYAGIVESGTLFSNFSNSYTYELLESVDMSTSSIRTEVVEESVGGNPEFYRIYKNGKVRSGLRKTSTISVGEFQRNLELFLDSNVSFVESIVDSDGNTWYEVSYMAQDTIFEAQPTQGISEFSSYVNQTPNQLRVKRVPRRFVVDHRSDGKCYLQFGQGSDIIDDSIKNLSLEDFLTTNEISNVQINNNFVVSNFFSNSSFGLVPTNTSLFVNYVTSEGEVENAKSNTIINIKNLNVSFPNSFSSDVRNSFIVNNPAPITGASFLNSVDFVRNNTIKSMSEQNRCVTLDDYVVRTKLLPSKFGSISKVYADSDDQTNVINIYVLSKDADGSIEPSNLLTKNNLKNYLSEFKTVGHEVNIQDAYIVNIGVNFDVVVRNGYNHSEVLRKISTRVEDYFDINKWEINQPIVLDDLRSYISDVDGLVSLNNVRIENKFDTNQGYSGVRYDVSFYGTNYDKELNLIYPPADPSIFELKTPRNDIKARSK